MIPGGMRHHRRDPVAGDHDIDIRSQGRRLHVEKAARMDDHATLRNGGRPRHVKGHRPRLAGIDVDDAELIERLVKNVPGVALPAWRMRAVRRAPTGRTLRLAATRHGPYREHALVARRPPPLAIPRAGPRRSPPSWCRPATTPARRRRASRSTAAGSARTI